MNDLRPTPALPLTQELQLSPVAQRVVLAFSALQASDKQEAAGRAPLDEDARQHALATLSLWCDLLGVSASKADPWDIAAAVEVAVKISRHPLAVTAVPIPF